MALPLSLPVVGEPAADRLRAVPLALCGARSAAPGLSGRYAVCRFRHGTAFQAAAASGAGRSPGDGRGPAHPGSAARALSALLSRGTPFPTIVDVHDYERETGLVGVDPEGSYFPRTVAAATNGLAARRATIARGSRRSVSTWPRCRRARTAEVQLDRWRPRCAFSPTSPSRPAT